jgi:hypothetical protein
LLSLADFRAPSFNLSVTRDGVGLEDEFELLMQLLATYFNWLRWSLASVAGSRDIGSTACPIGFENAAASRSVLYSM